MLPIQIMNLSNIHSDVIQNENLLCNQCMFLYYYYDIKDLLKLIDHFLNIWIFFSSYIGSMFCWIDAL